jgi:hypothetical protein
VRFAPDSPVDGEYAGRITGELRFVQSEKAGVDRRNCSMSSCDRGRRLDANRRIERVVDIESDLLQIEPQKIYLHRIAADLVIDAGVLDSGMNRFPILPAN